MNRPTIHARRAFALLVVAFLCLALAACGGGNGGSTTPPPANPTITSVTVNCASSSVTVNGTVQCTATVQGTGNFSHDVTWSSTAGTVSSGGFFTAPATVPSSPVTITATSSADSTKKGTATVTVNAAAPTITSVVPTCVKNTAWTGDTVQCSAEVQGSSNPSQAVTWSVDKGSITPSGGLFTASATGTATITATSVVDSSKKGTFQIAVSQSAISAMSVSCDSASVEITGTVQCTATVLGYGNFTKEVTWTASAGSISTNGLFTAPATVPAQTVVITARSSFDQTKTGTANITVTPPTNITGVTLTCPESSLPQGLIEQCTATVQGTSPFDNTVDWSATGGQIASLGMTSGSSYAIFTAPTTSGNVSITATAHGDSSRKATKTVTITAAQGPAASAGFTYKGVTHVSWSANEYNTTAGTASQDAIAATNFNWAGVLTTQYMARSTSNTIAPVTWTPSDASVIAAITELHNKGLKVMLKPHVDVQDGTWRGSIAPSDPTTWFANYKSFILHFAQLAKDNNVEMLCIGTELKTMSTNSSYLANWTDIITSIKAIYSGKLAYAANASSTNDEFKNVVFWDQVDVIGLDGYFSLTNHADPTITELVNAWSYNKNGENIVSAVTAFANAHSTQPVIFTEIGYRSAAGGNINPWDYQVSAAADNLEQQNCYEAMFRVWTAQTGWPIKGYFMWDWAVNPPGPGDTDYNPRNKPAQTVLLNWQ